MTVETNDTIDRQIIAGVGPYNFSFRIFSEDELAVCVDIGALDPVPLSVNTHYTVSGVNDEDGGTLTLVAAVATQYAGDTLDIRSRTTEYQPTSIRNQGRYLPEIHEDAFDRLSRQVQDMSRRVDRKFGYPDDNSLSGEMSLRSSWADKWLYVNSLGVIEPASAISPQALTQTIIGLLLNVRTLAEITAGITPTNYQYREGVIDRYGTNTSPGTTDMTTAINAAVSVAHAKAVGGEVVFIAGQTYRTTSAIVYPPTSQRIHMYGNGATLLANHIGDGITWLATNENYSGHSISDLTITGPNGQDFSAVWTSTGNGVNMNRDTTTNAVTAYNNRLRNVTIQGFKYGINLQAVIGLSCTDCYFLWNEEGIRMDGGQTNANCFTNCHIRYNRKRGIASTGRSGGSLTATTNNKFIGCLIESNVPDPFVSGGTVPTDSVGVYLNNSYDFVFLGCYSENHAASIYLEGAAKGHKFIAHRIAPGLGRLDVVWLSGSGVWNNEFDIHADSASLTEVNVRSDHANQQFNSFRGNGLNFENGGAILGKLDFADMKPSIAFGTTRGYGLIRMPSQGYTSNVDNTIVTGIGTGAAALLARGLGEIVFGNGITGNTTITTVSELRTHSFVVLRGGQNSFQCNLSGSAFGLFGGVNIDIRTGMQITLWVGGDGTPREVGRNFGTTAAYSITNPSADRALNVTGDTLAQVAAVLGTLIQDLKDKGYVN